MSNPQELLERARAAASEPPGYQKHSGGTLVPTRATRLCALVGELADALENALLAPPAALPPTEPQEN